MVLGKSEFYSLLLIQKLSKNKHKSISAISQESNIPIDFLYKIASKLKKSGILKSKEGITGGYEILKNNISLYDIIFSIKDSKKMTKNTHCNTCKENTCPQITECKTYNDINESIIDYFKNIKIK